MSYACGRARAHACISQQHLYKTKSELRTYSMLKD